jgi:hypothetical protein
VQCHKCSHCEKCTKCQKCTKDHAASVPCHRPA